MLSIFRSPSRYVQGRNATDSLGAQLTQVGLEGPALFVASPRTTQQLSPAWRASLDAAGIPFAIHAFGGECTQAEIAAGAAAGRTAGSAVVIGAGGGKALDAARAIAHELRAPIVNCPTLASSDAPCSAVSVIYSPAGVVEGYRYYSRNPDLVLVDTSIIARAPRRHLVSGMGDALATWYEARSVIEAHQVNQVGGLPTMTAGALAKLCCETLMSDGPNAASAVDANSVTPALERIVEANTLLSGLGFESGGLAIAHAVHNGLTAVPQTHPYMHGEKVAFGLLVQLVVEGRPSAEVADVIDFCRRVGLPTTLSDVGLSDLSSDDLSVIADVTVRPQSTAHHEPFPVTAPMIADGVRAADAMARDH
jgi:glycerol dehydrogenase